MKKVVAFMVARFLFVALVVFLFATSACAESSIMDIVNKFISTTGGKVIESRDIGGLQEIVIERIMPNGVKRKELLYATSDYIIVGSVFDSNFRNLTHERLTDLNRVDFSKIPLESAITIKKGDGSKKLVMFTDVDCPFCRRAAEALSNMDNYTLYVFLYPLNEKEKSVKILCSSDKVKALNDAKNNRPLEAEPCKQGEETLAKHILIATTLELRGTPLFILQDGRRVEGFIRPVIEGYLLGKEEGNPSERDIRPIMERTFRGRR